MSAEMIGALVLGGDFQGLGVLESLASKGVPTHVADCEVGIARFSRHCDGYSKRPAAREKAGEPLVEALLALADEKGLRGWVLIPNDDETVEVLSKAKTRLAEVYRVPVPDWDSLSVFADKRQTQSFAESLGMAVPLTHYPENAGEVADLDLEYPVIVKPRAREPFYSATKLKAVRAGDRDELLQVWQWAAGVVPPTDLMVQELVPGGTSVLYSLGACMFDGRLVGHVVAHRRRQHPMDFGRATTLAETVDVPEVESLGTALLREAGYEGLAEVEFMRDPRSGVYKLLEVNPRVWGWHTLAKRAGVDLPWLFYSHALGSDADDVVGFEPGVKWVRPITDMPTAVKEIASGRLGVGEYLTSIRGPKLVAPPVSWRDPAPFAMEFLMIPYLWARRGF
jgi:D-aspartate ligase